MPFQTTPMNGWILMEDGIGNNADIDDDNDDYEDSLESSCFSDPLNNSSIPLDLDKDEICNVLDDDIDGDGLPNDLGNK